MPDDGKGSGVIDSVLCDAEQVWTVVTLEVRDSWIVAGLQAAVQMQWLLPAKRNPPVGNARVLEYEGRNPEPK